MTAIIVDSDTLRAIGLRHMLDRRHDIEAVITADPRGGTAAGDSETIYFVTPEAFASMPYFYVPRRERVVLISDLADSPLPVITPHAPEENLRQQIDEVMSRLEIKGTRATLSDRERQVVRLVALGHINKEIAEMLGISFNTVLTHRKNISTKLGLRSPGALSVYAVMNGLVAESDLRPAPATPGPCPHNSHPSSHS